MSLGRDIGTSVYPKRSSALDFWRKNALERQIRLLVGFCRYGKILRSIIVSPYDYLGYRKSAAYLYVSMVTILFRFDKFIMMPVGYGKYTITMQL